MATIRFNDKEFIIDDQLLNESKQHIKNNLIAMNGSGAVVEFDNTTYNVDAEKLAEAKTRLIQNITLLTGTGTVVTIDGVEYHLDAEKLQQAVNSLEENLDNLANLPEEPEVEDELQGTWVFNDTLTLDTTVHYSVNFTSNGVSYTWLTVWHDSEVRPKPKSLYFTNSDVEFEVYYSGWYEQIYKTITITSKLAEVTDGAELLTWLKANATKQGAQEPSLPIWNGTDLTGTTWNIPAGWSATAGYGIFYVEFTYSGETFHTMYIGYNGGTSKDNYITIAEGKSNIIYLTPSSELSFTFNEGGDTSLIDWLKENGELTSHQMPTPTLINFTIEGTSYQAEEGMIWKEWASSTYNTSQFYCGDTTNQLVYNDGEYQHYIQASGTFVLGDDAIINGFAYTDYKHRGGGAD